MTRPRALDLFCKAGGVTRGLQLAGFHVTGVDIEPQPRYCGDEFIQADALTFPFNGYDLIATSPPCQRFSTMTQRWRRSDAHPDLIEPMRKRLLAHGKPYWIENVPGAPLLTPVILCGSMFGLSVRRHRHFELSFTPPLTPSCDHSRKAVGVYGHAGGSSKRDGLTFGGVDTWRAAMGIPWMTGNELAEAIPPAYSEFLGRHFLLTLT
jgi:DNA (cytosine-5)-methyltransferase 1